MKCLRENNSENALCRKESKEYLECRMERQVRAARPATLAGRVARGRRSGGASCPRRGAPDAPAKVGVLRHANADRATGGRLWAQPAAFTRADRGHARLLVPRGLGALRNGTGRRRAAQETTQGQRGCVLVRGRRNNAAWLWPEESGVRE